MSDPNATNANDTEVQTLTGIPNSEVAEMVEDLKADPRYIKHRVIPENGDTSTIVVTLRKA